MDVLQIAESRAELLHRLSNWGSYSTFDGSHDPRAFAGKLDAEELWEVRLASMTAELAASRARAANREFGPVLMEVELEVAVHLARILAGPGEEVGGPVCGVCLEEMEMEMEMEEREGGGGGGVVGLGCLHEFHESCILEWLKRKRACPLCRYHLEEHDLDQLIKFSRA
ncbi:43kDa postsynaptic protein [Trema orientale]|uniref:RING-type E3 ubiquitin transferase n=1 Tax=Trema orientale TaxID=63057 RepID=A0A2P5FII3_TREOI|nr:43kDa postsynaptic protein [Trema orientale]